MRHVLGLRGRLTAALLAVSVLTLAIAMLSLLVPLDRQLRHDALASLTETARTATPAFDDLPPRSIRAGSPRLERAVHALRRRAGAEVAAVDRSGRVLATTEPASRDRFPDAVRAIRERRLMAGTSGGGDGEVLVAVPLNASGRRFGLALRKSLKDVTATQSVVQRALPTAGLIALAVALLAGVLLASRLVRRLTTLRDTALRVAERGPDADVETDDSHDEIGDLTRAFATMQQRLREQEHARRAFVSTASHELRTPLSSLRLMLHSASEELAAPAPDLRDARDQLDRAIGQSERLGKLAAELLDLSRLDAGLPLRSELVELGELARSVLAEFEPRTANGGPRLVLAAPAPRWAMGDPGSLAQIVRILLDNALRHSTNGVPVRVDVGAAPAEPALAVRDGGAGVAAGDVDRIFERFERGADGGFGLGLAVGRELARRMGGELSLAPERPGATFVLALPDAPPG